MTAQPQPEDTTPDMRLALETLIANAAREVRSDTLAPDLLDALDSRIGTIRRQFTPGTPAQTMADLASGYWEAIGQWANAASTGLTALDGILGGGLLPKRLVALLGAPGYGKTALATQIAETVAAMGRPVCYLTSEDSNHMILCRALARIGNLDYGHLLRGIIPHDRVDEAMRRYAEHQSAQRMVVVEQHGPFSLDGITATAAAHFGRFTDASGGPGLLVVDYLQRLARSMGSAQELRQAVTLLTERLRDVAHDLGCTVLVLSAQGRDTYRAGSSKDANTLGTAKESGDIEYTCDCLMALAPGDPLEDKPNAAAIMLRVDKNRQGPTGAIKLSFHKTRQMFTEQK